MRRNERGMMKHTRIRNFTAACLMMTAMSAPVWAQSEDVADLILTNGEIMTAKGWSQAVAVRKGVIVAVGHSDSVLKSRGEGTQVVDLGGKAVLPGLYDMHVHVQFAGLEQYGCRLKTGAKPSEIVATVAQCAKKAKPGEWIQGGNWVGAVFKKGEQTRALLDKVAPNNPVILIDESHHSIWTNSKALELAEVTRDTPNPEGGVIERDAKGEPTGVFRENGNKLIEKVVPDYTLEQKRKAVTLATNQMLSYGIVGFTDALVRDNNADTLSSLAADGMLRQYVRGCIIWTPGETAAEVLISKRVNLKAGRLKFDCVKMVMDGVPTESHTAAMLEPYLDQHGAHHAPSTDKGILMVPQDVLNKAAAEFDRQGLTIKFHAAGDAAVRAAIDAVEYSRKVNGWGGPKHDLSHNSFVNPADIGRVRGLHMTWEFSPYIWFPTPITSIDVTRAVGEERMKRFTPVRDGYESGALTVAGSDWSVVPSVNPWLAIETMVTRQVPGGGKETIGKDQSVPIETALRIFTANGAAHLGRGDEGGTIEVGKTADLIILDRNPVKIPITDVHNTKVLATYISGEKVFDAANPPELTAR